MSDTRNDSTARTELRLTKAALVVILLGLCVVGRRTSTWPIITWPMYSATRKQVPPPVTHTVELRVIDETGRSHRVVPTDIIAKGRQEVAERAIVEAFDPDTPPFLIDAHRRYLAGVMRRKWPEARLLTIEGWRTEWAVDPFKLPPLDLSNPTRKFVIGSFTIEGNDSVKGAGR
jgi:hypothetical protein